MGKRSRRKNNPKFQHQVSADPENEIGLMMVKENCIGGSSESIRLMKEVKDCISEIYSEHINDLEERKRKRLDCKIPTDFFQPYNLVVNWPFQHKIRLQIQAVIKFQLGEVLKDCVISCMNSFIDYLQDFVKKFDDKKALLRGIILYEAYHTLQNSISQVGNIVSELISKYAFDIINKKTFYEKIAIEYFELIEDIKRKEYSQYIVDLSKMKIDLENLNINYDDDRKLGFEYESTFYSDSCSDVEENVDAMHNLSVEELFRLLTEGKKKSRRKRGRRRGRKNNQFDIATDQEIDKEVEEFVRILDMSQVSTVRLKPAVSEEFLIMLREKIKSGLSH
jgi:hypothetical protein